VCDLNARGNTRPIEMEFLIYNCTLRVREINFLYSTRETMFDVRIV